jgi:hypothetical protein
LNIFPNLAISLFKATSYWYCNIQQFVPVSSGRTEQRGWFFRTKFLADESAFDRLHLPFSELIRARIIKYYIDKIGDEDHRACEKLQRVAHQVDKWPILGSQEKRIGWFEEAYAHAMSNDGK